MSDVLNYASPSTKPNSPGWGFWLLLVFNGLSLGVVSLIWTLEIVALSRGNGIIGDSYGPIVGIVIGIPSTIVQFLLGTMPAMIYAFTFRGEARRRVVLTLLAASILAFLGIGSFTAACMLMPSRR